MGSSHHSIENFGPETIILGEGGRKEFPTDYKVPKLQKFDGRKGNTQEHISRFLDYMGKYASDEELCLRGVLQISEGLSLTCYQPQSGSIQDWEHIVATFKTKFFFA